MCAKKLLRNKTIRIRWDYVQERKKPFMKQLYKYVDVE